MDKNTDTNKAIIAAVIANVVWGFSFMATRVAITHAAPSIALSMRFIASFAIMLVLVALGIGKISLKGKPLGRFLLMGLCEPVIYFIAETEGIRYTNSSFSGLMIGLIPIGVVLLSHFFLGEPLPRKRFMWIICSVAGVGVISVSQSSDGVVSPRGVVFLLIAILSGSLYSVLSKSAAKDFTDFERTFIMMLMGFVFFTSKAVAEEKAAFIPQLAAALHNTYVVSAVFYLSVISSVAAFFLINYSFTRADLSRVAVFTSITPLVSVLAGVLLLGEPFSFSYIIGMILILAGVFNVNRAS